MAINYLSCISETPEKPLNVVIIGGSLAGLMQGIVAKRLGHNVRILEQFESAKREGQAAGMSIMEYGTAFLKAYDTLHEVPFAISCPGVQILDRTAKVRLQIARPLTMTSWNVLYYRLRANFDGLTSSYCPEAPLPTTQEGHAVYEHGKMVTNVRCSDGDIAVEYADENGGGALSSDLVIAADGSTSRVREMLLPGLQRTYSGYAIWRGTVPEQDITETTRGLFKDRTNLMATRNGYIALYTIPGENGTLEPGQRLLNYVWYVNYPEGSSELAAAMTDTTGKRHRNTLPIGKMDPTVWNKQKAIAQEMLPREYYEVISKTTQPFISVVSDIASSQASFFNGKLLLVGDALVPFRPHVACSTNQAALDALLVNKLLTGEIGLTQWETRVMGYANVTRLRSITWGCWYQVGYMSYGVSKARHLLAVVIEGLRGFWYG